MKHILIVDDDASFGLMLKTFLEKQNYRVESVLTASSGIQAISKTSFNLVITDLRLPDLYGLDFLEKIKKINSNLPVMLMTGYADIKSAVESMKLGAIDYLTKPIKPDELLAMVTSVFSQPKEQQVIDQGYISGKSEVAKQLEKHIDLVAPTDISVIIEGESGTGKEYVANAIHNRSQRRNQPFVAVDCGALPRELTGSELFGHIKGSFTGALDNKKGHFETANGGTLFLDEIGNLSYDHQILLLRAMQEKVVRPIGSNKTVKIDVRVVAATNESLASMAEQKKFREDLYFRLNEFSFNLPSLRERIPDIPLFLNYFLADSNRSLSKQVEAFEDEAIRILQNYHWPGNLRELKNIVKRAVLLASGSVIKVSDLPLEILHNEGKNARNGGSSSLKLATAEMEREMIVKALSTAKFNKTKAAKILQIDRKTLYAKIEQFDIDA